MLITKLGVPKFFRVVHKLTEQTELFMGLFWRSRSTAKPDSLQRSSCTGCSTCFDKPIESMPPIVQGKLDQIRGLLIEARTSYVEKKLEVAKSKAQEVKIIISEISSSGDFRNAVDSMFAAHVPEAEIQQFIAKV